MRIFNKDPFAQHNAEEEIKFIDDIFYEPAYYRGLKDTILNNGSRFLLGQRGDGKSMVIYKLLNDITKDNNALVLLITRFDNIPLVNNEQFLLYKIAQMMTIEIAKRLFLNKKARKKIDDYLMKRYNLYLQCFYDIDFADEFIEKAREIKRIHRKNLWKRIYNRKILGIANNLLNTSINVLAAIIKDSFSNMPLQEAIKIEFLSEMKLTEIRKISFKEADTLNKDNYIKIISDLSKIGKSLGLESVVVLFDKLDEFQELRGDIAATASFCQEILTDTDLLLDSNIAVVFSLWSELKREASILGARFDKFGEISVTLENDEIIKLINKRLKYFAKDKNNPPTFETLIKIESQRTDILDIAAKSPRTLIRLLGVIYNKEQNREGECFTPDIINKALLSYCKTFDFLSLHPHAKNRQDLTQWINKLLKVGKSEFTATELQKSLGLKGKTVISYIKSLTEFDLIRDTFITDENESPIYVVIEPRIVYLMRHQVLNLD
ncbi:MAG: hypothetical protein J1F31_07015 [Erysipelotrichales bacterium]|nr:hypothetical protein [Erysipelotrichales bacterium]